jgi:hypothetical protein
MRVIDGDSPETNDLLQAGAILRHGSARLHPHVSGRVGVAVDGQHNLALGGYCLGHDHVEYLQLLE